MIHRCRYRIPGGTYFFTVNLLELCTDLLIRYIEVLREAVRRTRVERPFHIDGWVVLPDHFHCVLTLPPGDDDFSNRIKAIKIRFVRAIEPSDGHQCALPAANAASGNADFGNMRFAMTWITPVTWTTFTTSGQTRPCHSGSAMAVFNLSPLGTSRCLPVRMGWHRGYRRGRWRAGVKSYGGTPKSGFRPTSYELLGAPRMHRQDPHPSRLVRPGPAPIARTVIASSGRQQGQSLALAFDYSKWPDLKPTPDSNRFISPSRPSLLARTPPRRQTVSNIPASVGDRPQWPRF